MFSLVIPFHNEEGSLPKLIGALSGQDDRRFEVIFVDNASTDRSADVVRHLTKNLHFSSTFLREARKGQIHALKKGVKHIVRKNRSGFAATFDADSFPMTSKWTSSVNTSIQTAPFDLGFLVGPISYVGRMNSPIWNRAKVAHDKVIEEIMKQVGWVSRMSNTVFTAEFLHQSLPLVEGEPFEKDLKMSLAILRAGGRVLFNEEPVLTSDRRLMASKNSLLLWAENYEQFASLKKQDVREVSSEFDISKKESGRIFEGRSKKVILRNLIPAVIADRTNGMMGKMCDHFGICDRESVRRDIESIEPMMSENIDVERMRMLVAAISPLSWAHAIVKMTFHRMRCC